jgi:hypothetical protein
MMVHRLQMRELSRQSEEEMFSSQFPYVLTQVKILNLYNLNFNLSTDPGPLADREGGQLLYAES